MVLSGTCSVCTDAMGCSCHGGEQPRPPGRRLGGCKGTSAPSTLERWEDEEQHQVPERWGGPALSCWPCFQGKGLWLGENACRLMVKWMLMSKVACSFGGCLAYFSFGIKISLWILGMPKMQVPWLIQDKLHPKSKHWQPSVWNLAVGTGSFLLVQQGDWAEIRLTIIFYIGRLGKKRHFKTESILYFPTEMFPCFKNKIVPFLPRCWMRDPLCKASYSTVLFLIAGKIPVSDSHSGTR